MSVSVQQLEKRFAFVAAAIGVALLAMIGWSEYSSWRSEMSAVERGTANMAVSFAQHAEDTIAQTYPALVSIAADIGTGPGWNRIAETAQTMQVIKASNPAILDLFVYDAHGNWLVSSARSILPHGNNADREYFKAHQASPSLTPRIGDPVQSRSSGEWVIPITMRFNHADGSFGGVVLASIRSRGLSEFFLTFDAGANGSAILLRNDGTILARSPFDAAVLGTKRPQSELFNQLKTADAGVYHYVSPVDGVRRIGGFHRSANSPLVVLTAVSEAETYANWARGALPRWLFVLLVIAGGAILGAVLLRRIRTERDTERRLADREAEFKLLTQHSHDLVERIDVKGRRLYVSPASMVVLGVEPEALIGTNAFDSIYPDDFGNVQVAIERLWGGSRSETVEFRRMDDGRPGSWLETTLSVLPGTPEQPGGVVAVTRDISARKFAELQLAELASRDGLTGIANRRSFDELFAAEMKRASRGQMPLSIVLFDADRFKAFNDTYGHLAGDDCLRKIAAALSECARRPGDMVARYGGEELVVLLPNTNLSGALEVAERMRAAVEALDLPHENNLPFGRVTISGGVASTQELDAEPVTPEKLIDLADWALYRAKENGRNQVVLNADLEAQDDALRARRG